MNEPISFSTKLEKMIPEDQRISMIATLIGASGTIVEQFMQDSIKNNSFHKNPVELKYACSLVVSNVLALIADGESRKFINLSDDPLYKMDEQTQEGIYRKMKFIVEKLYEYIQFNEVKNG